MSCENDTVIRGSKIRDALFFPSLRFFLTRFFLARFLTRRHLQSVLLRMVYSFPSLGFSHKVLPSKVLTRHVLNGMDIQAGVCMVTILDPLH